MTRRDPTPPVPDTRAAERRRAPGSLPSITACLAIVALAGGCGRADRSTPRVIVLGFDGMDYALTRQLLDAGRLPHFQHLAAAGFFGPLGTSVPPQSPVAWSNFITGMDAGGHGLFDFVHRDPESMLPYLSTTRTAPGKSWRLGKWRIPLTGGDVLLLRHGPPFWEELARRGIETTIVRVPANFPPDGKATRELSGMGTPDLLGTYGTFTFFTSDPSARSETRVNGGRIVAVRPVGGAFRATLRGPTNSLRADAQELAAEFAFYADPDRAAARLVLAAEERLLQEGEWSDWLPVQFALAPLRTLRGTCRFYLKRLRPTIELYVSPINLDPMHPAMPISTPETWAAELARATGRFYTQGMPEDTKAYSAGVFSPDEFLAQARLVMDETIRQYRYLLAGFESGFFFYYFGGVDQVSHMMWRPMDPEHPAYDAARDGRYAAVVPDLYAQMDAVLGLTLAQVDTSTVVVVMSDHGFTSWRRAFHLNAWLREQGYLAVKDPDLVDESGMLTNVDWSRTRAYGLGLNGLYLNLQGRERWGVVPPVERDALADEITAKLLQVVDPATSVPAVSRVDRREEVYVDRGHLDIGPDLILGYAKGTRCADNSAIGSIQDDVFTDNTGPWSGDHCMDPAAVPGILLVNRKFRRPVRKLEELAAALLAEFGVEARRPAVVP
jgi:predicted AlkP superfamily phosphohydrolase/phosphomutase